MGVCVRARALEKRRGLPRTCIKYLSFYYATRFGVGTKFCSIDDVKQYGNMQILVILGSP